MVVLDYPTFLRHRDPSLLRSLTPGTDQLPPERIDPLSPFKAPYTGFFREEFQLSGETREVYLFIPDTFPPSGPAVTVYLDDQEDGADFLATSPWVEAAAERGFALTVLCPNGAWQLAEDAKRERALADAWRYFEYQQRVYVANFARRYTVAYGRSADVAIRLLAQKPNATAGLVAYGASDAPIPMPLPSVPLPVWLIGRDTPCENATAFFRKANRCDEYVGEGPRGKVYRPSLDWPYGSVNESPVWQVISATAAQQPDGRGRAFIDRALDFLFTVCRGGGNQVNGVLLPHITCETLGVKRERKVFDGKLREWYVYVPPKLRGTDRKHPMLMGLHGYSGNGADLLTDSELYKIADARGVIIVCPSAFRGAETCFRKAPRATQQQWNSHMEWKSGDTDDVAFLDFLMEEVLRDYPIDPGRCYLTGVSNGSMMVEKAMFMLTERFAAYAASSGNMNDTHAPDENVLPQDLTVMPPFRGHARAAAWIVKGEFDMAQKGMDVTLTPGGSNYELLRRIAEENGMRFEQPSRRVNGVWQNDTWLDEDRAPLLRYTLGAGYPHGFPAELAWQFWDDFFCHFLRKPDGTLVYQA